MYNVNESLSEERSVMVTLLSNGYIIRKGTVVRFSKKEENRHRFYLSNRRSV